MNKIDEIALRVADKYDPRENYFPYRNDLLLYVKELLAELSNEEKPDDLINIMVDAYQDCNGGYYDSMLAAYKALLAAARSE